MPTKQPHATAGIPKGTASRNVDAYGLDAVCADISDGKSLTAIAKTACCSVGTLLTWIESDPERSARVRDVRAMTARLWDHKAVEMIEAAENPFELSKARDLAHHYRWRASKIAPRDYGDKLDLTHGGQIELNDAQLDARIAAQSAALVAAIREASGGGTAGDDRGAAAPD
jgi:hypothetical protein